ncbi:hypothetical protein [Thiohalophilus sp.]|uniref:hypothetical protein n=1 Tax=Thiohalophilus sp. TaxID=3028392 RepID=UPI002ACDC092|nr:hypothetical protein [Thiohalophilus sp.]MDZ7804302.1 hypothetical protein [Thiohalophilus sp.]
MEKTHALSAIASAVWAITDEGMNLILSIAQRDNESPEAVAAKLGRPLMNTRNVEDRGGVAVIPIAPARSSLRQRLYPDIPATSSTSSRRISGQSGGRISILSYS